MGGFRSSGSAWPLGRVFLFWSRELRDTTQERGGPLALLLADTLSLTRAFRLGIQTKKKRKEHRKNNRARGERMKRLFELLTHKGGVRVRKKEKKKEHKLEKINKQALKNKGKRKRERKKSRKTKKETRRRVRENNYKRGKEEKSG